MGAGILASRYTARMAISPERILYEDDHLLAVNKLAGELTVMAGGKGKLPLFDFLHKTHPGLRVLHRLDFGTSGIVVFAKTAEAAEQVKKSKFAGWKKTYRLIAAGYMETKNGTIKKPLPAREHDGNVEAITHYRVIQSFKIASYVEATIETGRKHQIRKHFASIGHPLAMDPLYGDAKKDKAFAKALKFQKFFLHAFSLQLPHPITGEKINLVAQLPKAFLEAIDKLRHRQ